jgi:hypothetical protein
MNIDDKTAFELIKRCVDRRDLMHLARFMGKNERIIELGVQYGKFSNVVWLESMPKHFIGIDVWDQKVATHTSQASHDANYKHAQKLGEDFLAHRGNRWMGIETIDMIKGDHSVLHSNYPDEFFDFVYIDSNHAYEPTVRDIDQWWPKVKKGGILAGHDYRDRSGIHKFTGEPFSWGVVEAVNEFAEKTSLDFHVTRESVSKSWIFLKPSDYGTS